MSLYRKYRKYSHIKFFITHKINISNVGMRHQKGKAIDGSAVKRLMQEDGFRLEQKNAFEAHNRATEGKDVLERCKRLNQFLESVSNLQHLWMLLE
jgi:hypothetical protein